MKHHWFVATALCLLAALCCADARAEVRVVTDRHGEYKMTRVFTGGRGMMIWSPVRRTVRHTALNLDGDRNGDLWPTIGESTVSPHYPWVVWSRYNETQYDLAWSRWTDDGWEPIRWLEPASPRLWDNLDADITFGNEGRPYVVWWRNEDGVGKIYVSLFLRTTWMRAYQVSEGTMDSRYPTIKIDDNQDLRVRYETAEGTVEQVVRFTEPGTITDDINPLDAMLLLGGTIVVDDEGD